MRKRLALILTLVLLGLSLATAPPVTAISRTTIYLDINGSPYCTSYHWCGIVVFAYDLSVHYQYSAFVEYEPSVEPSASLKGVRCQGDDNDYCDYVSQHTCSTSGCAQWGGAEWASISHPYEEWVDVWQYTTGRLKVTVTGTTGGYITYNGYTVKSW